MKMIRKFELHIDLNDPVEVAMPRGAVLLSVQNQQGKLCVWAEIDTDMGTESRYFEIRATDQVFDGSELNYIGTVQFATINFNVLVWHIYESTYGVHE